MAEKTKIRFKLLPYRILARHWMFPAILMIPAGIGLWWSIDRFDFINPVYNNLGWLISIVGALITLYTILAHLSHLSLQENRLVVHAPIHPMAVSYERIKLIHPMEFRLLFPKNKVKRAQYRLYRKLWRMTVPVVILEGMPMPKWWIKLWFHPFLLHPDEDGLVLVVDDWMACSRALDTLRTDATKTPWQTLR